MNILDLSKRVHDDVQSYVSKTSYNLSKGSSNYDYEQLLIKLEQDIRSHIKIEFQLKIYCDSLESRLDALEKENAALQSNKESKAHREQNLHLLKQVDELQDVTQLNNNYFFQKLKSANIKINDLKSQIQNYSTINNISIRNNTIHYLNDAKSLSLNKKAPFSSNLGDLSNDSKLFFWIILFLVREGTPESLKHCSDIKRNDYYKAYIETKPVSTLKKFIPKSKNDKGLSSLIGHLSQSHQLNETLASQVNCSVSKPIKILKKVGGKEKSQSLNFNNQYENKRNKISLNTINNSSTINLGEQDLKKKFIGSYCKPSSIASNRPQNAKSVSSTYATINKHTIQKAKGLNQNSVTKHDNSTLKTYIYKMSERKIGNEKSQSMKTLN